MIVIYLKADNQFLQAIKGFPKVEEIGNKLYFKDGKVLINDLTKAGYAEYPDQKIEQKYASDEYGEPIEVPQTIKELNLRPMTAADRPRDLAAEIDDIKSRLLIVEQVRIK